MSTRLIIEGNSVYEIDEDCLECSRTGHVEEEQSWSRSKAGHRIPENPEPVVRGVSEWREKPGNLPAR